MLSEVGVLVKRCKGQSVDIEGLSIEGGAFKYFACYDLFTSFTSTKSCSSEASKSSSSNALIQLTFSRQKVSRVEIKMFNYSGHQNKDTKRSPWVVVHSNGPINNSCSFCAETAYLAIMLQTFWHIAEGN